MKAGSLISAPGMMKAFVMFSIRNGTPKRCWNVSMFRATTSTIFFVNGSGVSWPTSTPPASVMARCSLTKDERYARAISLNSRRCSSFGGSAVPIESTTPWNVIGTEAAATASRSGMLRGRP